MRTDEQLIQIGKDLALGKIFTSEHVRNDSDIPMVFMILMLLDEKDRKKLQDEGAYILFEYMDKAGPRSVNGYPCFMSLQYLTKEEWEKVHEVYTKAKKALDEIKIDEPKAE